MLTTSPVFVVVVMVTGAVTAENLYLFGTSLPTNAQIVRLDQELLRFVIKLLELNFKKSIKAGGCTEAILTRPQGT